MTVKNFDARSVQHTIPQGVAAYVANVTINGVPAESRCHFDFYDTFRLGGEIELTLTANKEEVNSCGGVVADECVDGWVCGCEMRIGA